MFVGYNVIKSVGASLIARSEIEIFNSKIITSTQKREDNREEGEEEEESKEENGKKERKKHDDPRRERKKDMSLSWVANLLLGTTTMLVRLCWLR